jgi:hypothetical protein
VISIVRKSGLEVEHNFNYAVERIAIFLEKCKLKYGNYIFMRGKGYYVAHSCFSPQTVELHC